ncbi:hypothetical protein Q3G72_002470 [Acer saccharum]|nr:hypothetical protein Q3G72_002470 [Acer saccharum]
MLAKEFYNFNKIKRFGSLRVGTALRERKGKGEIVSPPPDPDNPKRWALFGNRKVWPERGINLKVFGSTFIPDAVETMGWGGFVRTPNVAALDLVREFYYAMVPHRFTQGIPVIVRGREILITANKINEWFGTSQDLGDYVDGIPNHDFFEPYNGYLAADLRMDANPMWNDYLSPLLLSELKLDAALWMMFFDYSLTPKTHRSELSFDAARHLFCARNTLQMDIGQIIVQSIHKGKKTYNELARRRRVRPIGANVLDDVDMGLHEEDLLEEDPVDIDYNDQNLEGDPNAGAGNQNPTMYQMMERMTSQLETNTKYLQALNQQMNSNHQAYMGEFRNINERLDGFQRGLVNHGVNIPFTYRREARRVARGLGNSSHHATADPNIPPQDPNLPDQGP